MGKTKTTGKGRLDKYYYLAKEQGYRSRAAFKLVQLNRKYGFLENARTLLDLCAAPGGWLQVAAKYMPVGSLIVGVDLVPIRPIRGCISLTEDITTPKCRAAIKRELKGSLLDVVLHDGSPNVGGAWAKEAYTQSALSLDALKLATELLVPGGIFVSKVFRSQDYNALLYSFNQLFDRVEATKPVASRSTSAEIYVICKGYRAPAKIDPRLLDAKHLFQDASEPSKVADVLSETKRKRHRDGYAEGVALVHKVASASDFLASDKPVEFLGTFNAISFGDSDAPLRAHPATTPEVLALCEDLRVLGKREFKQLLKWRIQLSKEKGKAAKASEVQQQKEEVPVAPKAGEEDEGEEVMKEMEELRAIMEAHKKRTRKLLAKRRDKEKRRRVAGMATDALDDVYGDDDLFSLSAIKNARELSRLGEEETGVDNELEGNLIGDSSDDEQQRPPAAPESDSDDDDSVLDLDKEKLRYQRELESYFERSYQQYNKATSSSKKRRRMRLGAADNDEELWREEEEGSDAVKIEGERQHHHQEEEEEANPLLVRLDERVPPSKEQLAQQWFSQAAFASFADNPAVGVADPSDHDREHTNVMQDGDDSEDDVDDDVLHNVAKGQLRKKPKQKKMEGPQKSTKTIGGTAVAVVDVEREGNQEDEEEGSEWRSMGRVGGAGFGEMRGRGGERSGGSGFEEVQAESSDGGSSSDDDDDELDYDSDEKAITLAYAKKMLRKKQREEIIDAAYNRYTFNDEDLPRWFVAEERKFMRPEAPITKEEVQAMKAENRAINTRPAKKVAEAKARKRNRAVKKLEQIRQRANSISDMPDMTSRAKNKMIESLYKKAAPKHTKKAPVVVRKGSGVKGRGNTVDKRLKKDLRGQKASTKGKGKGASKGGGKRAKRR